MDKNTEKLILEKNSKVIKDTIKQESLESDLEFMNSEEPVVIAKAIIEKGELVYS